MYLQGHPGLDGTKGEAGAAGAKVQQHKNCHPKHPTLTDKLCQIHPNTLSIIMSGSI